MPVARVRVLVPAKQHRREHARQHHDVLDREQRPVSSTSRAHSNPITPNVGMNIDAAISFEWLFAARCWSCTEAVSHEHEPCAVDGDRGTAAEPRATRTTRSSSGSRQP